MMLFLRILAGLALIGVVVLLAIIFVPYQLTPAQADLPEDWRPDAGQGEYVMRLADCAGCHNGPEGTPFAGGYPLQSPVGEVIAPNITPHPEAGIGDYTLDEFRAVLYDGVAAEGHLLYPAMPYANYRKMPEEDVRALYAYLMEEVEPVAEPAPRTDLPFPFDQRWGLRLWQWLALPEAGFTPSFDEELLARGEYIVQGPGHCGACHSGRNLLFIQEAYHHDDPEFLDGGEIAGWTAPDLRDAARAPQSWSVEQTALYLGTGRNAHAAVVGEMELVIEHSTQHLAEEDLMAVAAYLDAIALPGSGPAVSEAAIAQTEQRLGSAEPERLGLGGRLYLDNCNACHFTDGRGADLVFPELAGNPTVLAESPRGVVQLILAGAELPSTEALPYSLRMPGFGWRLNDFEVAELATFLRSAWGNDAAPVAPAEVARIRALLAEEEAGSYEDEG